MFSITIRTSTDDTALLGDGVAPADWADRRSEYVQDYMDRCQEAALELAPEGATVEVHGGEAATRVSVQLSAATDDPDEWDAQARMAQDLEERISQAIGQAWIDWTESL